MKDFYSDNGSLISKLFPGTERLPDFLKSAEFIVDKEDLGDLDDNAFADPQGRTFPVYDKAASYVSMAYFIANDESDPEIEGRIKKACSLFGLDSEIRRLADVIAERKLAEREKTQKTASEAPREGWLIQVEDGSREFSASGYGKEAFFDACDEFLNSRELLMKNPMSFIKEAAAAFVGEALELGGEFYDEMPDDMLKLAGYGYPDNELLEAFVSARSIGIPLDQRHKLVDAVHSLKTAGDRNPEALPKIAEFLENLDDKYNLRRFYGDKFPDPLRSVHNVSTRKVAQMTAKVQIGDQEYYLKQLDTDEAKRAALHILGDDAYAAAFKDGYAPKKLARLDESLARGFNQVFSPDPVELELVC